MKLQMFLHAGETEVGGFGVSAESDLLYVQDFVTVRQQTTCVTVEFADTAVADYYDDCVDGGLSPARFARVWCHTHPGESPEPSSVDEETFARVFGDCDWSVMFILSRTGQTYARLAFAAGPGGSTLLPVNVDWAVWPDLLIEQQDRLPELFEQWMDEFGRNIHPREPEARSASVFPGSQLSRADVLDRFAHADRDAVTRGADFGGDAVGDDDDRVGDYGFEQNDWAALDHWMESEQFGYADRSAEGLEVYR
jgi:proteasome lid subunit RPN8/RPN11